MIAACSLFHKELLLVNIEIDFEATRESAISTF